MGKSDVRRRLDESRIRTMHVVFSIFQLWLAPMHPGAHQVGMKTTLQVGSNAWVKIRVQQPTADISRFDVGTEQPRLHAWYETDF